MRLDGLILFLAFGGLAAAEPEPCDIDCWMNTWLPPEMTYLMKHTYIVRPDVEPDAYYIVFQDEARNEKKCMKFFRHEVEDNLEKPTNARFGLISFVGGYLGEGERADYDRLYCDPAFFDYPVMPPASWIVADNFWSDTRPMYAWNDDGTRGAKLKARVAEWTDCENETLRTSTRSNNRDREYRYATNAEGVRGATLCWERLPEDPVPTEIVGAVN